MVGCSVSGKPGHATYGIGDGLYGRDNIEIMTEPVPRVVLDTTAIVGTSYGHSGAFTHLLRDAADRRVTIIVPELVLGEAAFVYRRELFDVREALEQLPGLMRAAGYGWDLLQRGALIRRMDEDLRRRLEEAGVVPVSAPQIDADMLVRRILQRRKPTKQLTIADDGREAKDQTEGFRDQLVWEHVRVAAEDGPVVFVTDNTSDFAVKKSRKDGRADLHPDLLEDLDADRKSKRSPGEVTLVLDVATFVRDYLADEDVFADMRRLLDDGAGEFVRDTTMDLIMVDGLPMKLFAPPVAVQGDVEAQLSGIQGPLGVELSDAYLESADDELREYGVTLTVTGEGTVDWGVSAPTGWDLDLFRGLVEGDVAGGGFIRDSDSSPFEILVYGSYRPSDDEWTMFDVEEARQPSDEIEQRQLANSRYLTRVEQDLGLLPSDEDLEAWEAESSRPSRATAPRPNVSGRVVRRRRPRPRPPMA
jgi:PIN domain